MPRAGSALEGLGAEKVVTLSIEGPDDRPHARCRS